MGVKENCEYTSREFAELLNVNLEFQNLVKKWIDILIDEGMMVKTNLGVIICRRDELSMIYTGNARMPRKGKGIKTL